MPVTRRSKMHRADTFFATEPDFPLTTPRPERALNRATSNAEMSAFVFEQAPAAELDAKRVRRFVLHFKAAEERLEAEVSRPGRGTNSNLQCIYSSGIGAPESAVDGRPSTPTSGCPANVTR